MKSRIEFKVVLLNYKVLNVQAPLYLKEFTVSYHPIRTLLSQNAGLLVVPGIYKVGGKALGPDTLSVFNSRHKPFLFDKVYS